MSKKYYVVSEMELNYLTNTASDYETGDCSSASLEYAKAACRARPVESIGGGMWQREDEDFEGDKE